MSTISFVISGAAAAAATDEFKAILAELDPSVEVMVQSPASLPEPTRKAIDPISLASLILSIPSFVLAVADITERIQKRRRAQKLIDDAKRLEVDKKVEIFLLSKNIATRLEDIMVDALLEAASK